LDQTTLSASNVAVTRVRKQSHQAHFSGETDWKLGKSGQKKIETKLIGPKFAENRCRLCGKLPKRNEIATGKANANADADSRFEIEIQDEDRPERRGEYCSRKPPTEQMKPILFVQEFGFVYEQCVTCPIQDNIKYRSPAIANATQRPGPILA